MENKELNFNYSECVKSWDSVGITHYKNICTSEEQSIPWGVTGYIVFGGVIMFILLIILLITYFIKDLFTY
jgi:hypothetical protein